MYILDTNVVSELRKATRAEPAVVAWSKVQSPSTVFISTMTIMELEIGVLRMERRDGPQGAQLRAWLEHSVLADFEGRIIGIDTDIARVCAKLHVPDRRPERDALIAATAIVHNLTVVTRNVADFGPMGVKLLDPWV